jgi:hypothetical protein
MIGIFKAMMVIFKAIYKAQLASCCLFCEGLYGPHWLYIDALSGALMLISAVKLWNCCKIWMALRSEIAGKVGSLLFSIEYINHAMTLSSSQIFH